MAPAPLRSFVHPDMTTEMEKPTRGIIRGVVCASFFLVWRTNLAADPPRANPQVFFDDFSYRSPDEFEAHGWTVRTKPGWPGIKNASWKREGVSFPVDPTKPGNRILRMTSSTDGTPAHTAQTQICQQRKFKEGTYAARVHFSDDPVSGPAGDGVVESCYTFSTVDVPLDPNYSECDFEYLPAGGWGEKGPALFVTTWHSNTPLPDGSNDTIDRKSVV
jgi:hypothetical protein